jgi:hypothetical protein
MSSAQTPAPPAPAAPAPTPAMPITTPAPAPALQPVPAPTPAAQPAPASQPAPAPSTQTTPTPAVPFAPRGRLPALASAPQAGISSMLEMTSAIAWEDEKDLSNNRFIPSAYALADAANACDNLMASTYRFNRAHPFWIPALTQVYISVLFYFRIFDVYVRSGFAPTHLQDLLRNLKEMFDFRRLVIPGPLVPHFQSLSLCSSGDELIGDVHPYVNTLRNVSSANFYQYNFSQRYLPNVLALLDYPTMLAHSNTPITTARNSWRIGSLHSVNATVANAAHMINVVMSPGFYSASFDSIEVRENFRKTAAARLRLPPRINQGNADPRETLNWMQFLRFAPLAHETPRPVYRQWFSNLSALMQDYCEYFSGSRPLADIPLASGPSPHIRLVYAASTDAAVTPSSEPTFDQVDNEINLVDITSLSAEAMLHTPGITEQYRQLATVAQTNARIHGHEDDNRDGDFWNMSRRRQRCLHFDIFYNQPSYVAALHSEQSLVRRTQ